MTTEYITLPGCLALATVKDGVVIGIVGEREDEKYDICWGDTYITVTIEQLERNYVPSLRMKPGAGKLVGKFYKTKSEAVEDLLIFRKF